MSGIRVYYFLICILIVHIFQTLGVFDHEIEDYNKVVFFHEILQRVEKPLQYETWKQRGNQLQLNKAFYKEYTEAMEIFQQDMDNNMLLKNDTFFGGLVKWHSGQSEGLFHFLFQALDWSTFVQNACWARQYVNAHMFVYAFTMAAVQRQIDHAMMLPRVYEILPRYFLEKAFVDETLNFEKSGWSLNNTNNIDIASNYSNVWQWVLTERAFVQMSHLIQIKNFTTNGTTSEDSYHKINMTAWWHAADYTRDVKIINEHAKINYFTEDVDWNAYWYLLNLNEPLFLKGKDMVWHNGMRRGEFWLYSLQQLLARYEMERLSHGFPETPKYDWFDIIENGNSPLLIELNGKTYISRDNQAMLQAKVESFEMLHESQHVLDRIEKALQTGYYFLENGTIIEINTPESLELISNLMHCNIDAIEKCSHWYQLAVMYQAGATDRRNYEVQPNVLLNYETMLRDPLFYIFHRRIVDNFQRARDFLPSYTTEELHTQGLRILLANVSELETYFDLYDLDASNLLQTNKANYWSKTILARQMRLTHKPFSFNLTINSEKSMTAMLRIFLAPLNDAYGDAKSLNSNRNFFLELNKIFVNLRPGVNNKTFQYEHYFTSTKDRLESFQSELYFEALNKKGSLLFSKNLDPQRNCGLHTRLLLPRGTASGLPMHLFFMITQLDKYDKNTPPWWKLCVPLEGHQPLGFPFDRVIKNPDNFVGPNMYWKAVKIYHKQNNNY